MRHVSDGMESEKESPCSIICNSSKNIPTIFVSLQRYNFDLDPLVDVPIQYIYERIKLKAFRIRTSSLSH